MITYKKGDLLKAPVHALVNTVNTVGVMGKGVALQFKESHPQNYKEYKKACDKGDVIIGRMFVTSTDSFIGPKYIINFPTKKHWLHPSKMEYIEEGIQDLKHVIDKYNISSIAIPPLGCGNGGLDWNKVKKIIIKGLEDTKAEVFIYEPTPGLLKKRVVVKKPKLTPSRAIILAALRRYSVLDYEATLVELQKLSWFLQRLGVSLKLNFERNYYGPYAHNLTFLLEEIDGYFLEGMKYKQAKPFDSLKLIEKNYDEVETFVNKDLSFGDREKLELLASLIEGFETPYGMELLATIDYILKEKGSEDVDMQIVLNEVYKWSERKSKLFKPEFVEVAVKRLQNFSDHLYQPGV